MSLSNNESFFKINFTPELAFVLTEAVELLEKFKTPIYLERIDELVGKESYMTRTDFISSFHDIINEASYFVLKEHSLILDPASVLSDRVELMRAVVLFQSSQDNYYFEMLSNGSDDPLDDFIRLVEGTTALEYTHLHTIITSVGQDFVSKINDTFKVDDELSVDSKRFEQIVSDIKALSSMVGHTRFIGYGLIESGFIPDQKIENYIPFITTYFTEETRVEVMALDIFSISLIAKNGDRDNGQGIAKLINLLIINTQAAIKIKEITDRLTVTFSDFKRASKH